MLIDTLNEDYFEEDDFFDEVEDVESDEEIEHETKIQNYYDEITWKSYSNMVLL